MCIEHVQVCCVKQWCQWKRRAYKGVQEVMHIITCKACKRKCYPCITCVTWDYSAGETWKSYMQAHFACIYMDLHAFACFTCKTGGHTAFKSDVNPCVYTSSTSSTNASPVIGCIDRSLKVRSFLKRDWCFSNVIGDSHCEFQPQKFRQTMTNRNLSLCCFYDSVRLFNLPASVALFLTLWRVAYTVWEWDLIMFRKAAP